MKLCWKLAVLWRRRRRRWLRMAEEDMRPAVEDDAVEMAQDLLKTKLLLLV
jgi:hypothetical protein